MSTVIELAARGFGDPCRQQDMKPISIFGFDQLVHELAYHPFKAAIDCSVTYARYRPNNYAGTYACRDMRGRPGNKSYHAWALAVDFDPAENPAGHESFVPEIARDGRFVSSWERFGFTWGGMWDDEMHFQYDGIIVPPWPVLKPGHEGDKATRALRRRLRKIGYKKVGMFGPYDDLVVEKLKEFQERYRLSDKLDRPGIVGSCTWATLYQKANLGD